jgi:hypothetical protein
MGLLKELRLRFRPPRIEDPDFGTLLYMYIPCVPTDSYWQGEWLFPPTETKVAIALPGGLDGPDTQAREFYLTLPAQFDFLLKQLRQRTAENRGRSAAARQMHAENCNVLSAT